MYTISPSDIIEHFHDLNDPRVERTKRHMLMDIVAMALCAVICGADGWVDVEQYALEKQDWLRTFLQLPHGIPSHDTFGRVFARLDPVQFQSCFTRWIQSICTVHQGEMVAIDGKVLRHSFDTTLGQSPIHMVSAWAATQRLVLGQVKVDAESNEITALPALLHTLDIADCTVTIDAAGCQKAIAAHIREKGADYILALKANQESLFAAVQTLFAQLHTHDAVEQVCDTYETIDHGHGRVERRRYWTTASIDHLTTKDAWVDLQTVGMVEAERTIGGMTSIEQRYYLLSGPNDAQAFGKAVRAHWGIENTVHWILDIAFREDDSRIRMGHGPENFAVLRHIALNLLQQEKTFKGSVKSKRLKAGWNNDYLAKIVGMTSL